MCVWGLRPDSGDISRTLAQVVHRDQAPTLEPSAEGWEWRSSTADRLALGPGKPVVMVRVMPLVKAGSWQRVQSHTASYTAEPLGTQSVLHSGTPRDSVRTGSVRAV
jgi:hypothetical protein